MKTKLLLILFFGLFQVSHSQEHAWVYFTDKPNEATFLAAPLTMLSQEALDRRAQYGILPDSKDVPLETTYVSQIASATGISVLARSKWLNALHIEGTEVNINALTVLSFVDSVHFADKSLNPGSKIKKNKLKRKNQDKLKIDTIFDYGNAANQIEMLGGDVLHLNNFTGTGMQIAVIDAGFPNVNTLAAFQRLRDNDQIKGGYDFVNRSTNFYSGHSHGTAVLSTIGGYVENQFVGTAPDADFYLFISEDSSSETPLEESLWVEAAEKADSLGVDVINTSLGYSTFDDAKYNYSYSDMDGETTFITRGADIAFSRGMIIVNSAGNEGNNSWQYVTAPADGFNVLTIGAVNSTEVIVAFSSIGPTSDGRIKPDVCAQGEAAYYINTSGTIVTGNGTSFSSPILTGVVACLWQAFPDKTNAEILDLVRESADLYATPTNQKGYGVPDFESIFNSLDIDDENLDYFVIGPNPTDNELVFKIPSETNEIEVIIYSLLGEQISEYKLDRLNNKISIESLSNSIYLVKVSDKKQTQTFKIIKNNAE